MSDVNISTPQEFADTLCTRTDGTSSDIMNVYIQNDIDFKDFDFSEHLSTMDRPHNYINIYGNGHTIKNIFIMASVYRIYFIGTGNGRVVQDLKFSDNYINNYGGGISFITGGSLSNIIISESNVMQATGAGLQLLCPGNYGILEKCIISGTYTAIRCVFNPIYVGSSSGATVRNVGVVVDATLMEPVTDIKFFDMNGGSLINTYMRGKIHITPNTGSSQIRNISPCSRAYNSMYYVYFALEYDIDEDAKNLVKIDTTSSNSSVGATYGMLLYDKTLLEPYLDIIRYNAGEGVATDELKSEYYLRNTAKWAV